LPEQLAGLALQGHDDLLIAAVRAEHESVADQDRRAAVAVDRAVLQLGVAPEDLAGEVEAGGPLMAEVDVQPLAVGHGRWAGVAVFAVDTRGRRAVLAEDL